MNNDRISEIRARCDAATPGPWKWKMWTGCLKDVYLAGSEKVAMSFGRYGRSGGAPYFPHNGLMTRVDKLFTRAQKKERKFSFFDFLNHPNAEFIAHAREDLPWALDIIAAQQAEIDRLSAAQRWIPVTEREPNVLETVLIYDGVEVGAGMLFDECYWGYGETPTHWMPLPAVPEKGDSRVK